MISRGGLEGMTSYYRPALAHACRHQSHDNRYIKPKSWYEPKIIKTGLFAGHSQSRNGRKTEARHPEKRRCDSPLPCHLPHAIDEPQVECFVVTSWGYLTSYLYGGRKYTLMTKSELRCGNAFMGIMDAELLVDVLPR